MSRMVSVGALLTTSDADIYVAPAAFTAEVKSIVLANKNGANQHVFLSWWNKQLNVTYFLLDDILVPTRGIIHLENALSLSPGDKIIARADVASHIRLSLRINEEFTSTLRS
jgi:hypothetical protein